MNTFGSDSESLEEPFTNWDDKEIVDIFGEELVYAIKEAIECD